MTRASAAGDVVAREIRVDRRCPSPQLHIVRVGEGSSVAGGGDRHRPTLSPSCRTGVGRESSKRLGTQAMRNMAAKRQMERGHCSVRPTNAEPSRSRRCASFMSGAGGAMRSLRRPRTHAVLDEVGTHATKRLVGHLTGDHHGLNARYARRVQLRRHHVLGRALVPGEEAVGRPAARPRVSVIMRPPCTRRRPRG